MEAANNWANQEIVETVEKHLEKYELVKDRIESILSRDRVLQKLVHSKKFRFKDLSHLDEKITRKNNELLAQGHELITKENVFSKVTDIVGIRVLHLYMGQFSDIHQQLMSYVANGDLVLFERPKAYSWDPEYVDLFTNMELEAHHKESLYTSVHYVFKLRNDNPHACEVQVRTLFEEVWGEIDHTVNYPEKTRNLAIKEQLKVLARVVGAGTRLSDSIFNVHSADV